MDQVVVYVDGFNLYNGLKEKHDRKYLWLDLEEVSRRLLKPHQQLVEVKYFTSAVRNNQAAQGRQHAYLEALGVRPLVQVHLGRFQEKKANCRNCGATWSTYEEKETDVSIAVALLEDGINGVFDTALLLSADSDLCPAVRALRRLCPAKRVIAVFPPKRWSDELGKTVHGHFRLGDAIIRQSLLAQNVSAGGVTYTCPTTWG